MSTCKILNADKVDKKGHLTTPKASPPPVYEANSAGNAPDITAAISELNLQGSSTPTVDQCIVHLKLLEAFHQLREDVALQDGLFGVRDSFVSGDERQRGELLSQTREKRWAVYVAKAVKRFESWWEKAIEPNAERLQQTEVLSITTQNIQLGIAAFVGRDQMPPLGGLVFLVIRLWCC